MGTSTHSPSPDTGHQRTRSRPHAVFVGNSEMAARCRDFPWEQTLLGPVEQWPKSLRSMVSTLLEARNPMFLWWGPDLIQFYNDAYRPSLGHSGRDSGAL